MLSGLMLYEKYNVDVGRVIFWVGELPLGKIYVTEDGQCIQRISALQVTVDGVTADIPPPPSEEEMNTGPKGSARWKEIQEKIRDWKQASAKKTSEQWNRMAVQHNHNMNVIREKCEAASQGAKESFGSAKRRMSQSWQNTKASVASWKATSKMIFG